MAVRTLPIVRILGVTAAIAIVVGLSSLRIAAAAEPGPGAPPEVFVATKGSLPGFSDRDLPDYFAAQMNGVASNGWHFAPLQAGLPPSPERVEISFQTNPYAAGAVKTYGISRATMERLLNVHHLVTIEARLFLGGQYQTLFFEEVTVSGGPHDAELENAIAKLTRALADCPSIDTQRSGLECLLQIDRPYTA